MELALWLSKRAHSIVVYGQSKSLKRAPTGKEPVVVLETLQGQEISQEYPDPFPEHLSLLWTIVEAIFVFSPLQRTKGDVCSIKDWRCDSWTEEVWNSKCAHSS